MTQIRSAKKTLTDGCIMVTITLAMLTGLEVAGRLLGVVGHMAASSPAISAEDAIGLKQSWGKQHLTDSAGSFNEYVTYVEFREKPHVSATLNIDNEGRRRVPGSCEHAQAFTVMAFGGSTMFGAGVPDPFTIPAYLADMLNRQSRCVRVVNYGSGWWQSSQSLIQLLEVIKQGVRPQVVIFYDGINEVNAVGFGGTPGGIAPDAGAALKQAFELDTTSDWARFAQASLVVRTLRSGLFPGRHKDRDNAYSIPAADIPGYATSLATIYATNVRTVNALAREYGFAAYFFLQPVPMIAGKHNTTLEEAAFKERASTRGWEAAFFRQSYHAFAQHPYLRSIANYYDLSRIFDGMTEDLYLDSEHLLPEGNKIVAERIARELPLPPPLH